MDFLKNEMKNFVARVEQQKTEQINKMISERYTKDIAPQIEQLIKNANAEKEKALQDKNLAITSANEAYTQRIKQIDEDVATQRAKLIAENRELVTNTVEAEIDEVMTHIRAAQKLVESDSN